MKKNKWMWVALMGAALSFGACGGSTHHHHHDEEEEEAHEHEHEGHHHDEDEEEEEHEHEHEHEHEGHAHEHEGHSHGGNTDEISISPAKAKAAGIKSLKLKPTDFSEVIEVSGRIDNAQGSQATVVASAAGTVKLNQVLTEGASVGAGSALMSISTQAVTNSDPYELAKITYEAAEQEYQRAQKLLENQLISKNRFTEIKERYETAKLAMTSVGKNYKGGTQNVTSPIGGYVQQCLVKNGDYVEVGQPLAVISANQRLYVRADVPEKYYSSLGLIQSANIKLPSGQVLKLSEMDGKVVSRGQSSSNSYYLPVTLSFDSQGKTFPGSFVEVYLLASAKPNTLIVPKKAVIEEQGLYFVFIQLDEDCYRKQEVKTGAQDGVNIEVLSGLKAGDQVVVEGAYQVKLAGASSAIPAHSHNH